MKNIKHRKGIALLVALGTMIIILILGSLVLFLIVRGLAITSGQARYETAYEAAVAALEVGKTEAEILNINPNAPPIVRNLNIGPYAATIRVSRASSQSFGAAGTAIKFARATLGPGGGGPSGYYRNFYVHATVVGQAGEQASLEAIQRFIFQP